MHKKSDEHVEKTVLTKIQNFLKFLKRFFTKTLTTESEQFSARK